LVLFFKKELLVFTYFLFFGRLGSYNFFEKKVAQTNLCPLVGAPVGGASKNQSFFCFFFVHKKEDSSLLK
jgi:hypothetical protein